MSDFFRRGRSQTRDEGDTLRRSRSPSLRRGLKYLGRKARSIPNWLNNAQPSGPYEGYGGSQANLLPDDEGYGGSQADADEEGYEIQADADDEGYESQGDVDEGYDTSASSGPPSPAPGTFPNTQKKSVKFVDGIVPTVDQKKTCSHFHDLSEADQFEYTKKYYLEECNGTEERWTKNKLTDAYAMKLARIAAAKQFDLDEATKKAAESGEVTEDTRHPISKYALIDGMAFLTKAIENNSAFNGKGGVSKQKVQSTARGMLQKYLDRSYIGTVDSVEWDPGWKTDAKPPEESITVALTDPRHKAIHKAHRLPQLGFKRPDGSELTAAEASTEYDRNYDETIVKIHPTHPLWAEMSNPGNWVDPPSFKALDKVHLQAMKGEQEIILGGGGSQADVDKAWDEKYGTKVVIAKNGVGFCNMKNGETQEGTTGDGMKVTMTYGQAPFPPRTLTVDASKLGSNPFVKDTEGVDDANASEYEAVESTLVQNANNFLKYQAAEYEKLVKARELYMTTPRPLPSKNNATCLSDMPTIDPSSKKSWNGYPMPVWFEGPTDVNKDNASTILARILTHEKVNHLLGETFPSLSQGVKTAISTAMGDSVYASEAEQAKIEDQIPGLLAKYGVQTDKAAIDKMLKSTSRAKAYNGQDQKKWLVTPTGSTKQLSAIDGYNRMCARARFAQQYPCKDPTQSTAIGELLTDQYLKGVTKEQLTSMMAAIKKKVQDNPSFRPTETSTFKFDNTGTASIE